MKSARQEQIVQLIEEHTIETQEELASYLNRSGFAVTQATVSRDIRELGLVKRADSVGKVRYTLSNKVDDGFERMDKYLRVLKNAFVSADIAGNLLVIKTAAGMAMAAAAALDELNWKEILGCIAGDNTIMCAVRSTEDAEKVMLKLQKKIGEFE